MQRINRIAVCSLLFIASSCALFNSKVHEPDREFRGFWVATVANIDWPKKASDPLAKKKDDYKKILNFYESLHFNAAIVQVRCAGDALYATELAPWSRYLTGAEGQAPNHQEDILQWMIQETHSRGMEFHAWLNPYRATMNLDTASLSKNHDFYKHRDWMLAYGKRYYYNPGLPDVRSHLLNIIEEIVVKYNIDAVHFDDYFYPYKISGETFNDSLTYYNCALPEQSLEDWRRSNIDSLVKQVHKTLKQKKEWVRFGVSPFGVWKNKNTDPQGSDTKAGQTTFEDLYADPLLWTQEGWIDYLVPQVYWSMHYPAAAYNNIVPWWANKVKKTNLYIGNGAYKVGNNKDEAWNNIKELPNQILFSRKTKPVTGNVLFSAKSLMQDKDAVIKYLKKKVYKKTVLPPMAVQGSVNTLIAKPNEIQRTTTHLLVSYDSLPRQRYVIVRKLKGNPHRNPLREGKILGKFPILDGKKIRIPLDKLKNNKKLTVSFLNINAAESSRYFIHLNRKN